MEKLRPWSMKEIQFLINNHDYMTNKELAKYLNRSCLAVICKKNILQLRKEKRYTEKEIEKLINMFNSGCSIKKIANTLEVPEHSIDNKLFRLRQKGIIISRSIHSNGYKKYTDKEIEIIKKLYSENKTEIIGKLLNRTSRAIYKKAATLGIKKTEEHINAIKRENWDKWKKTWYWKEVV